MILGWIYAFIEWIRNMDIFNLGCGLATLLGTGITIWQAYNAKNSAKIAEEAKNAVLTKKRDLDFAAFIIKANEIERTLGGWTNSSSKGRSFKTDYEQIQAYISDLNKIIPHLTDKKDTIEKQYNKINEKIQKFNQPVNGCIDSDSKEAANDMLCSVRIITRELQTIIIK